jgi:hypothetical protein
MPRRQHGSSLAGVEPLRSVAGSEHSLLQIVQRTFLPLLDEKACEQTKRSYQNAHGRNGRVKISDLVRLTTICDIYAALLERRSYKGSIAPDAAYDILLGMKEKLDYSLVRAFRLVTVSAACTETMMRKTVTGAGVQRLASA